MNEMRMHYVDVSSAAVTARTDSDIDVIITHQQFSSLLYWS